MHLSTYLSISYFQYINFESRSHRLSCILLVLQPTLSFFLSICNVFLSRASKHRPLTQLTHLRYKEHKNACFKIFVTMFFFVTFFTNEIELDAN